jgi:hypothetical protein
MRPWLRRAIVPSFLFAAILVAAPAALASGSGYNLSFTQSAASAVNPGADLVALSSTSNGAGVLTISFSVAGTVATTNPDDFYYVYFGGNSASTATGYFLLNNNTNVGDLESSGSGSFGFGTVAFTVGSGGSSLSFPVNISAVGPSSSFSLNALSTYSGPGGSSGSAIGSDYTGGETCNAAGCIANPVTTANTIFSGLILIGVITLVAIVVIIVVVVIVVTRKKKAPPPPMGWAPAPGQGMTPPPPPPPNQPPAVPPPGSS